MKYIERLARKFREAIDVSKDLGELEMDFMYKNFPRACCGDTSYLLAEYLMENGIKTLYVCGTYKYAGFENMQSHAWLYANDEFIVDITGDQFKYDAVFLNYNKSVYVGEMDEFHKLFNVEERDVHECYGLSQVGKFNYSRLEKIYTLIRSKL